MSAQDQFQPDIDAAAKQYGINPTWLARLLQRENNFKVSGTSPAGAQGIAQFMPGTARQYGVDVNDPHSSIFGAAHYLHDNLNQFGGNLGLATAAYNWGGGNLQNWLKRGGTVTPETADYVKSITGKSLEDWRDSSAGTSLTSHPFTPPHTLTPPTAGPQYTPAAVAAANPPTPTAATPADTAPKTPWDWVSKGLKRPADTVDKDGNPVKGKSPLEKIASSFDKQPGEAAPEAARPAQFAPVQDPMAQMAGPAAQLFSQIQMAAAKPLSWSTQPYGYNAGPQVPGTTLTSAGY